MTKNKIITNIINALICSGVAIIVLMVMFNYMTSNVPSVDLWSYVPEIEEKAMYEASDDRDGQITIKMAGFSDTYIDAYITACLDEDFPEMEMNREHDGFIEFSAYNDRQPVRIIITGDVNKRIMDVQIRREV